MPLGVCGVSLGEVLLRESSVLFAEICAKRFKLRRFCSFVSFAERLLFANEGVQKEPFFQFHRF